MEHDDDCMCPDCWCEHHVVEKDDGVCYCCVADNECAENTEDWAK